MALTEEDITQGAWCSRRGCHHLKRLHTPECQGINGSHNDPEGGEWACRCPEFEERSAEKAGSPQ